MMKYFICILLFFTIIGCSGDDDTTDPNMNSSGLNGKWSLVQVTGGFVGVDDSFENGVIVWDFNEAAKRVQVTNNNTKDVIYDVLPSGTYDYTVDGVQSNLEFVVDKKKMGKFQLIDNQFTVEEQLKDGFRVVFRR